MHLKEIQTFRSFIFCCSGNILKLQIINDTRCAHRIADDFQVAMQTKIVYIFFIFIRILHMVYIFYMILELHFVCDLSYCRKLDCMHNVGDYRMGTYGTTLSTVTIYSYIARFS